MADYFPLQTGLKLDYRHKGSDGRVGKMRFEVLSATDHGDMTTATCVRIFDGKPSPEYVVTKNEAKGWVSSSAWGKEFPLPPVVGQEWESEEGSFRVDSLNAEIQTSAGNFTGCLKVVRLVAGGDGGYEERYYAPGVGLVYALSTDEGDPYELTLAKKPAGTKGVDPDDERDLVQPR